MLICLKSKFEELKNRTNDSSKELIDIPEDTVVGNNEEGVTKTVVKIFLNQFHEDTIKNALKYVLKSCLTPPNIILAYAPASSYVRKLLFFLDRDFLKILIARFKMENSTGAIVRTN